VVTVLALAAAWTGYSLNWIWNRHHALDWIESQAEVWRDVPLSQHAYLGSHAPWQLRILGETGMSRVCVVVDKDDAVASKQQELERLFPEADVLVVTPGPGFAGKKQAKQPE
jgi:hypothetical protein